MNDALPAEDFLTEKSVTQSPMNKENVAWNAGLRHDVVNDEVREERLNLRGIPMSSVLQRNNKSKPKEREQFW